MEEKGGHRGRAKVEEERAGERQRGRDRGKERRREEEISVGK